MFKRTLRDRDNKAAENPTPDNLFDRGRENVPLEEPSPKVSIQRQEESTALTSVTPRRTWSAIQLLTADGNSRSGVFAQRKMAIGAVGDKYEQEADRAAKEVVRRIHTPQLHPDGIQPKGDRPELTADHKILRRRIQPLQPTQCQKMEAKSGETASQEFEQQLSRATQGGQSLDANIQAKMEAGFGADFSGVKVHADGQSDRLSRSLQAKAFTTGTNIFFKQGEYNPNSRNGQELLAHELTHVVQQNGNTISKKASNSIYPENIRRKTEGKEKILEAGKKLHSLQDRKKFKESQIESKPAENPVTGDNVIQRRQNEIELPGDWGNIIGLFEEKLNNSNSIESRNICRDILELCEEIEIYLQNYAHMPDSSSLMYLDKKTQLQIYNKELKMIFEIVEKCEELTAKFRIMSSHKNDDSWHQYEDAVEDLITDCEKEYYAELETAASLAGPSHGYRRIIEYEYDSLQKLKS